MRLPREAARAGHLELLADVAAEDAEVNLQAAELGEDGEQQPGQDEEQDRLLVDEADVDAGAE